MKLTAQQQLDIRQYLQDVVVVKATCDELYDHIVTAMEQKPASGKLDMSDIKHTIDTEFGVLIHTEEEKRTYRIVNNAAGFVLFAIALITYWLTMEPTVSFWDCGEFIAAANKLEVGHQPGAPLFLLIGKFFSLLALSNTAKVAYWVNFSAVLSSAATIMFLFWTITALVVKVYRDGKRKAKIFNIIAAGAIGALAYTFSDTFWFSAVEAEVYALSSLFTAITFWAILKWENRLNDKWLIFIAFIIGLSTGVHLLSLLTIPAITLVYYYKKSKHISVKGTLKALAIGCMIVGIVQFTILQYFVLIAAKFDLLFVNTFGFSFGSGALFFVFLFVGLLFWAIRYTIRTHKYALNLSLLCLTFLLFGFSAYMVIMIRANAKPTINLSNPDNPYSLYNYLGRTNYEPKPLLYGKTFDAATVENKITGNTYRKGSKQYEISGNTYRTTYDKNMLFPRTYSEKPRHVNFYKQWMGLSDGQTPTFTQNLKFFATWQVGVMYWRYFLWNFAGRQNDIQGYGDIENGNWISGIKPLDALFLGNQSGLPLSVTSNEGHNVLYGLPLILGIAGIFWLFKRNKQLGITILTLFFFTGLAIILYLNQDPEQVRERDYAYAGSFYAFSIFIGIGFLLIKDVFRRIIAEKTSRMVAAIICFIAVPVWMGVQGWDDHNRSDKTTALDWAKNYLNSCAPNAILFTNADNDTYPLWYAQEVEGIRTDVRVICIQFLSDASFINQMKQKVNASAPLSISMDEDKYVAGVRDFFPYVDYGIQDSIELNDLLAVMTSENQNDKVQMTDGSFMNFLPTRKLKLTVDAEQLIQSQTIGEEQRSKLATTMEWSFDKPFAGKADLVMLDILAHNNWKRPIYFATSVSEDTYMGLDKYLYLEGYAYRLLPFKPAADTINKTEQTNTDKMYDNVMHKLDFTAFHKAKYLDPESRRIINSTWRLNNTLAGNLIAEGKDDKAVQVMQKSLKDLPLRNFSVGDTLNKIYTIQNLYKLNQIEAANNLTNATCNFLIQELTYLTTLSPAFQQAYTDNIQIGLYVLDGFEKITGNYEQKELSLKIRRTLSKMITAFNYSKS